jgi:sulfate/thiosulfate transport system permease protein
MSAFSITSHTPNHDPKPIVYALTVLAFLSVGFLLLLPLVAVFAEAFSKGPAVYFETFRDPVTQNSIFLTLRVAVLAVPLNTIFGVAAAWAVTRFTFPGRRFLISLIELPLWVSPVIGGMVYTMIFGLQGWLGGCLEEHNIQVIFAYPGLVLATIFVTFPFVARVLIPLMESLGQAEEEAAVTLGARGWQVFWRITVPRIKMGLLYGIILCNARAMGEFGAVSVVSGHIRNQTCTMPLQIEILHSEYQFAHAFALASILSLLGIITLMLKVYLEGQTTQRLPAEVPERRRHRDPATPNP